MSSNSMQRNQCVNNNFVAFFHEKDIALSQIELDDVIYENSPVYTIKSFSESKAYNSNIILISSASSNDGMAQLIFNSSLVSTCLQ